MTSLRLVFRNVRKNMQDHTIYFLTLMISVSLFYAFNSIQSQPALSNLSATKQLLSDQMGKLISALSVIIAIVLGFLMVYANGFLLKRRKKELGIYTLLGMEKGKISRIFAGETMCVGMISLVCGLLLGVVLSQGLALLSLRLFAVDINDFQLVFSVSAAVRTVGCFALIFLIAMLFNVKTITNVKLIDMLTADRKNETLIIAGRLSHIVLLIVSVLCIIVSGLLFQKYGILPNKETPWFQVAAASLAVGTVLLFYSASAVILKVLQAAPQVYLRRLNMFLSRQIGSKIRTDFLVMAVICGNLTIAICGLTAGISTALAMNEASRAALPFDLNVLAEPEICGETDIAEYLRSRDVDMERYAKDYVQISLYNADFNYADVFAGQDVTLWRIDEAVPESEVAVITVSDFNKSMTLQGKEGIELEEDRFLLNCNYEGTFPYIEHFLQNHEKVTIGGITLYPASMEVARETYFMTSVGNNDRGTFIVPDRVVGNLEKDANILLVQYGADTDADEVVFKMVPIGLEWETEGYRYTAKNMMQDMYYSSVALIVFLSCYIGLIFLLICAALLSLKQLTETADNIYRYGLLRKLGTDSGLLYHALFWQVGIFFLAPMIPAAAFSVFGVGKIVEIVGEFINLHVGLNSWFTVGLLLLIYGGYFLATFLSCKRMVQEKYLRKVEV